MISVFVDTSVLLHAVGGSHPRRDAARELLGRVERDLAIHVGAETIQEFLFHRLRVGDATKAVEQARWLLNVVVVHPFDVDVARAAVDLVAAAGVGGRDAVLAATAREAGFDVVVTHDSRFVAPPGLRTLGAADYLASLPR
ncbi:MULTISPECIES: type II toxin-antitoxin system VapC family toxin [unclassified Luteococcus]|uniref:type II toxin-antitoxin system VapC family toxin n=1 Tax=unclassified Luteococcus TaxID=2639923 RepID=UPI00313B8E6E